MKTKTWKYGTRLIGTVETVIPGSKPTLPRMTMVLAEHEGFVIMGVEHQHEPIKGQPATIEFKQGGPTGGYWQIVNAEPKA